MTTLFKKTLLATALLAAGSAGAATVTSDWDDGTAGDTTSGKPLHIVSLEGLNNKSTKELSFVGTAATGDLVLNFTNTAVVPVNDVVTITLTGAKFKNSVTPTLGTNYTFIDFKDNDTTARFRRTTAEDAANSAAALVATVTYTTLSEGAKISAAYKTISQNSIIGEYDSVSKDVFEAKQQVSFTAGTSFDEKISTTKNRKELAGGDDDTATLTVTNNGGTYLFSDALTATETAKVVHEIKGDFSWLADADSEDVGGSGDADGTITSTELAQYVEATVANPNGGPDTFAYALSADKQTLTVTRTAVAGLDTGLTSIKLTAPAAGKTDAQKAAATTLAGTTFVVDTKVTTGSGASLKTYPVKTAQDLGEWKLDGSTVRIPFMTVQEGKWSGVVRVANSSAQDGAIKLDIYDVDGTAIVTNYTAASTAKKNSSVNVYSDILAALKSKSIDTVGKLNQLSVTVVTEVPADKVQVYSAFTDETTKNRYIVNNDGKVQTKTN